MTARTGVASGWLIDQLPESLRSEQIVVALARVGQEVGDSFRFQLDALDAQIDPRTATPAMLAYVASWFDFTLDPDDDLDLLRRLVGRLGPIVLRRGTPGSLRELAELLTGSPVRVEDPGYVVGPSVPEPVTTTAEVVRIQVRSAGPLGADRVRAILAREVPVGVRLELVVAEVSP